MAAAVADAVLQTALGSVKEIAQALYDLVQGNLKDVPEAIQRVQKTSAQVLTCVRNVSLSFLPHDVSRVALDLFRQLCRTRYQVDLLAAKKGGTISGWVRKFRYKEVLSDLSKLEEALQKAHAAFEQALGAHDRLGPAKHVRNMSARGFWREAQNAPELEHSTLRDALHAVTKVPQSTAEAVVKKAVEQKLLPPATEKVNVFRFDQFIADLEERYNAAMAAAPPTPGSAKANAIASGRASWIRADQRAEDAKKCRGGVLRVVIHHAKLKKVIKDTSLFASSKMSPKAIVTFPDRKDLPTPKAIKYTDTCKKVEDDADGHTDPQWDAELKFDVPEAQLSLGANPTLSVYVFGKHKSDLIGRARLDMREVMRSSLPQFMALALYDGPDFDNTNAGTPVVTGTVWVTVEFAPAGVDEFYGLWDPAQEARSPAIEEIISHFADEKSAPAPAAPVTPPRPATPPKGATPHAHADGAHGAHGKVKEGSSTNAGATAVATAAASAAAAAGAGAGATAVAPKSPVTEDHKHIPRLPRALSIPVTPMCASRTISATANNDDIVLGELKRTHQCAAAIENAFAALRHELNAERHLNAALSRLSAAQAEAGKAQSALTALDEKAKAALRGKIASANVSITSKTKQIELANKTIERAEKSARDGCPMPAGHTDNAVARKKQLTDEIAVHRADLAAAQKQLDAAGAAPAAGAAGAAGAGAGAAVLAADKTAATVTTEVAERRETRAKCRVAREAEFKSLLKDYPFDELKHVHELVGVGKESDLEAAVIEMEKVKALTAQRCTEMLIELKGRASVSSASGDVGVGVNVAGGIKAGITPDTPLGNGKTVADLMKDVAALHGRVAAVEDNGEMTNERLNDLDAQTKILHDHAFAAPTS